MQVVADLAENTAAGSLSLTSHCHIHGTLNIQSINQHILFEYNSHSGWLQKTHTLKFDIKIIQNNQIKVNS